MNKSKKLRLERQAALSYRRELEMLVKIRRARERELLRQELLSVAAELEEERVYSTDTVVKIQQDI